MFSSKKSNRAVENAAGKYYSPSISIWLVSDSFNKAAAKDFLLLSLVLGFLLHLCLCIVQWGKEKGDAVNWELLWHCYGGLALANSQMHTQMLTHSPSLDKGRK